MSAKDPRQPLNYEIELRIGLISADRGVDPWDSVWCELCSGPRSFWLGLLMDGGLSIPQDIYARYLIHGRKNKIRFITDSNNYSYFKKGYYYISICRKCEKLIVEKYK